MSTQPNEVVGMPAEEGAVVIEYCGEWYRVGEGETFTMGRGGDLVIDDDNRFLHRQLLQVSQVEGIWILANVGSRLSVTVTDQAGRLQSWLAPGARLPLVFGRMTVVFTAGPTTYEIGLHVAEPTFRETRSDGEVGGTTIGNIALTPSQHLLLVALAEPLLQREGTGMAEIPTSAKAAARLGWALSRFNRKLDNVCDKLDRIGVQGLRGGVRSYANNRRIRLVEYAIATRLVTSDDLPLLDNQPVEADAVSSE